MIYSCKLIFPLFQKLRIDDEVFSNKWMVNMVITLLISNFTHTISPLNHYPMEFGTNLNEQKCIDDVAGLKFILNWNYSNIHCCISQSLKISELYSCQLTTNLGYRIFVLKCLYFSMRQSSFVRGMWGNTHVCSWYNFCDGWGSAITAAN